MQYSDYVKFHVKILLEGYKKGVFTKAEVMEAVAQVVTITKYLKENRLLNSWEPAFWLESPKELKSLTERKLLYNLFIKEKNSLLLEEISSNIPENVNAAMQSQIDSIKKLRNFYIKLKEEEQQEINEFTKTMTKNHLNFIEEIEDIEDEINGIYGELKKGGLLNVFKKGFGYFQRAVGSILGSGKVETDTNLDEKTQNMGLLDPNSQLFQSIARYLRKMVEEEKTNYLRRDQLERVIERVNQVTGRSVTLTDVANAAHSQGINVQGILGTLTSPQMQSAISAATQVDPARVGSTLARTTQSGMPEPSSITSRLATRAASGAVGAGGKMLALKAGGAAAIGGLLLAGLARNKMKKRKERIDNLIAIARMFKNKELPK
jgi:uncharacterized protein (UPF0335 family)